jgi:hypothetical protein
MSLSPSPITLVEHMGYNLQTGRCLEVNILLAKIIGIKDAKRSRTKGLFKNVVGKPSGKFWFSPQVTWQDGIS